MNDIKKTRIIIADDHPLFVGGLQLLLKEEGSVEIVEVANNGKALLEVLTRKQCDVILLDINMPEMNGLEAAQQIKYLYPQIKVVVLSTYHESYLIEKAREAGVNGYLLKNCNKDELLLTIQLVMKGKTSFPHIDSTKPTQAISKENFSQQVQLTRREHQIIKLIKEGLTNQQIADQLFLSVYTVETHRKNIMQKLHLNNAPALMKYIIENNL